MGKTLSYEEVKNYIESYEGYELISDTYVNAHSKLIIKCPNGHISPKGFNNFKNGSRCKKCSNELLRKLKQTPIESIIKLAVDSGYTFVSWLEEYKNNRSKIQLRCNNNHEFESCYAYLKNDKKCPYCFGNKRIAIDLIKEEFLKRNYTLISTEYIDAHTKLEYICNKHPEKIRLINWNNFNGGKGCRECGIESQTKHQMLNGQEVFKAFDDKGLIVCEGEKYTGAHDKIRCICKNHLDIILELSYGNISITKFPCKNCYIDAFKGENNPLWKGGTSLLHDKLRDCIQEWKNKSMEFHNYRCVVTGQYFNVTHHLYSFNKIVDEVFNELQLKQLKNINDYTQEQIDSIKIALLNKHYDYGYGVTLCSPVHNLFHDKKLYGKYDNTPEQFEEFVNRYKNNEFDNSLEDKFKYCNNILNGVEIECHALN